MIPDTLCLKMADFIFKVEFKESYIPEIKETFKGKLYGWFKECIVTGTKGLTPDVTIIIQDSIVIDQLRNITHKSVRKNYICLVEKTRNVAKTYYYINFLQFRLILREMLQELLTKNKGFQIHASGVIVDNSVALFVGKHTAGKSTTAKLVSNTYPIFADDSVVIRRIGNNYYAFQTFEYEKNYAPKTSKKFRIRSINFLHKNRKTEIIPIHDKSVATDLLLKECWALDQEMFKNQFSTINDFINTHNTFNNLYVKKNDEELYQLL